MFDICFLLAIIFLKRLFRRKLSGKDYGKGIIMISIKNLARTALSVLSAFFFTVLSFLTVGPKTQELPTTPADFTPVVRFAVCSDVHFKNDNELEARGEEAGEEYEEYLEEVVVPPQRLAAAINSAYDYADNYDGYKGLDAFAVAGDFTNRGKPEQYEAFVNTCNENLREGTQRVISIGNHEFMDYGHKRSEAIKAFEKYIGAANSHYVINGYHFIAVSYDELAETYVKSGAWLKKELDKAVADTGDKPIFVFQHPAPFSTIYGSIKWGDKMISAVLKDYPQVVDFSGHSHYPINDPRSIWQGKFTALGCGTLAYFETELDTIDGNFPGDFEEAAQYYIVEADKNGNVRIRAYDIITEQFFDFEYYLCDLAEKNYPYSLYNLRKLDGKPVFENGGNMTVSLNEDGETILSFDGAKDRFVTESYKLTVSRGAVKVFEDNFSGKYMYLFEEDCYNINLGKLRSGKKYTVVLYALNAFAETSKPVRFSFTAA